MTKHKINPIPVIALALAASATAFAIVPGVETTLWPNVAKIGPASTSPNATATAIGDHWVITAGHVAGANTQLQFVLDDGRRFDSSAIHKHPTDDIALIEFSETLPSWQQVHWDQPATGSLMEMIGYGRTGTLNGTTWSFVTGYGVKRRGRNVYSTTFSGNLGGGIVGTFMVGDFDGNGIDSFGDGPEVADECTYGTGDSGGAVLIQQGGVWKLAGINDFIGSVQGGPNPPQWGSIFGAVRISDYRTWIETFMPREVVPTSLTPIRGNLQTGRLSSLFFSDDDRLVYRPGATLSTSQSPVEFEVGGTSPALSTSQLAFAYEGHATGTSIVTKIELLNQVTGLYEVVSNGASTTGDSVIETVITSNPNRFIDATTGEMRARISAKAVAPVLGFPWSHRVDRAVWNVKMN